MAKYIDRQALLNKLCDGDSSRMEDYYYNAIAEFPVADVVSKETHDAVVKALVAFAETDVVQVVRCKDCKHCAIIGKKKDFFYNCDIVSEAFDNFGCFTVEPEHFCSCGERKV